MLLGTRLARRKHDQDISALALFRGGRGLRKFSRALQLPCGIFRARVPTRPAAPPCGPRQRNKSREGSARRGLLALPLPVVGNLPALFCSERAIERCRPDPPGSRLSSFA